MGGITILAFCLGFCLCPLFEFLRERLIVEENPWVIELAIPGPFQISHRWNQLIQLFVTYEGD